MKIGEIRERETPALDEEVLKLRREAFRLRMQRATGQDVSSSRVRDVRRTIARIETVLGERRQGRDPAGGRSGA